MSFRAWIPLSLVCASSTQAGGSTGTSSKHVTARGLHGTRAGVPDHWLCSWVGALGAQGKQRPTSLGKVRVCDQPCGPQYGGAGQAGSRQGRAWGWASLAPEPASLKPHLWPLLSGGGLRRLPEEEEVRGHSSQGVCDGHRGEGPLGRVLFLPSPVGEARLASWVPRLN